MRNIKIFCLITTFIVMIISLTGCGADNNATGGKSSLFGKYEFFTDEDMELFRMDELSLSINGNTYTLGMTKNEIEDMLGEKGEGYGHSASKGADSSSTGNQIIEPDSYEYYQSVNNYYYYPNNKMAVIYRSVQDGQETNNPAVLISVNNSALVDAAYGKELPSHLYEQVFCGEVEANYLEIVFAIFNTNFPKDYRGRSMSVSDVLEVMENPQESKFYYCDSVGFKEVEFDKNKTIPTQKDVYALAYSVILRQITAIVLSKYPNARWIWEEPNAKERIEKGEELHILLNSAGGYKRATVVITNLQVTDILFGALPAEPSDHTEDDEDDEPMDENYELLAFEWVESHIVELNARINEAIGKGKSELLLKADELPTKESWDDIRYELEKENIADTKCIPDGILIKLKR